MKSWTALPIAALRNIRTQRNFRGSLPSILSLKLDSKEIKTTIILVNKNTIIQYFYNYFGKLWKCVKKKNRNETQQDVKVVMFLKVFCRCCEKDKYSTITISFSIT